MTRSAEIPEEARKAAALAIHCRLSVGSPSSWIGGVNPPSTDELADVAVTAALPYLAPAEPEYNATHPVGRRSVPGIHHAEDCPMRVGLVTTGCFCGREGEREPAPAGDGGQTVEIYFCPAGGEVEQYPGGGFDVCCDAPERHIALEPSMIDQAVACWLGLKPSGGVSDAAVEAAAKTMSVLWENYTATMRTALEAAKPYMVPEVVIDHRPGETCSVAAEVDPETGFARVPAGDGGLREALEERLEGLPVVTYENGYPSQALPKAELIALLALHPAAPAVPQPVDREALIWAMCRADRKEPEGKSAAWLRYAEETFGRYADAMLAVLAGEQEQVEK